MWIAVTAITLVLVSFAMYFIGYILCEILKPIGNLETFTQVRNPLKR